MNGDASSGKQRRFNGSFLLLVLLLGGTLAVLCHEGFKPYVLFWANDLPLGALVESSAKLPASFFGSWSDFYWLGGPNVAFPPTLTNICMAILTPVHHLKFYVPMAAFFLGFSTWFFFRQLRFQPLACVIGGLAAGLNMHFFSNGCWGLGQWSVCAGLIIMAMGVLVSPDVKEHWLKGVLAGLCTGLAVMEGYDSGAILSLYVAAFVVFLYFSTESNPAKAVGKMSYVGMILVVVAVLVSLSTAYTLIATQIKGVATGDESAESRLATWDRNTQWSLPKTETLRTFIPGLMGYRMDVYTTSDTPEAYYWGSIAEDPHFDLIRDLESKNPATRKEASAALHLPPQITDIFGSSDASAKASQDDIVNKIKGQVAGMQRRHTGSGEYTGELVWILALFALANTLRKKDAPYSVKERRMVWFWGGAALISLMAAWGRHGFFYGWLYHLPYINNSRNPVKYLHPFNVSMFILAGFGVEVFCRKYLVAPTGKPVPLAKRFGGFEKYWMIGGAVTLGLSMIGYLMYNSSFQDLLNYIQKDAGFDAGAAQQMARFSIAQVGWFVIFMASSLAVIFCIMAGWFAKKPALAWIFLGAIMICDLSRADTPFIRYYNYKEKIGLNPVVDYLRHEPWEHRVNSRVFPAGGYMTQNLTQLCHWWIENDYPFNDIQTLEIDQDPRMAVLESSYLGLFNVGSQSDIWKLTRLWQLTNTRYIFVGEEWLEPLNDMGEPKASFRNVMRMNVVNKPGVTRAEDAGDLTVQTNSDGPVALLEFTRALPRVKLYANWTNADDQTSLHMLGSKEFDPEKTVVVSKDAPVNEAAGSPDADAGTVKITHYESKHLIMEADAKTPAVMLRNERTGDSWNVWIDGQPGTVLRCNYIMQGVYVPAGHHIIDMKYQPPLKLLWVSLATLGAGILLTGFVVVRHFRQPMELTNDAPPPAPAGKPGKA